MTKYEFEQLRKENSYWNGRWNYISKVIEILKNENFNSVLELGAYDRTIVKDSDTMDKDKYIKGLTYHWDATQFPYPVNDKEYDLFIALQVWEHLYAKKGCKEGRQKQAFNEVLRISNMAILSFPYKWNIPNNCHSGIDERKIKEWTMNMKPEIITRVGIRIIYFFKFDGSI